MAVEAPDTDLHVPALCDVEVTAAVRRALLGGNLSVYDAAYVALAEALGAALLTADRSLERAVRQQQLVEVVASDGR